MARPDQITDTFQATETFYRTVRSVWDKSGFSRKYPLTDLWGRQNMNVLLDVINRHTDPASKISAIHDTFMFSVNTADEAIKAAMIDWYVDYFSRRGLRLADLDPAIQESVFSNQRNAAVHNGRLIAPDFLRTVILALEIQRHCNFPSGKSKVLELGAGYGGLARTLKLFHPGITYVIVDIPETLYFSSTFLRLNFPQSNFCYVTDPSILKSPLDPYDFVFVPAVFAEELAGQHFELFCNTASLGEMTNSVIEYWMDFVQNKARVKYFFGLNRFLNTMNPAGHRHRLNENRCSVSFDRNWRILHWELEPPFTRCPYLETEVTRNLEVIAERLPKDSVDVSEDDARSQSLVHTVSKQDWFVHYNDDNTMLLRDNSLAPDLTMRGTLFALWESIRLRPNRENITMMLQYLITLTRGKPFEEMFYYRDMLRSLGGTFPPLDRLENSFHHGMKRLYRHLFGSE